MQVSERKPQAGLAIGTAVSVPDGTGKRRAKLDEHARFERIFFVSLVTIATLSTTIAAIEACQLLGGAR